MIDSSNNNFFKRPKYSKLSSGERQEELFNHFYKLDCDSGIGVVNPLLIELEKVSSTEFKKSLNFLLKKCINVNRDFSDAVKFLSIWLRKSPSTLLRRLERGSLKKFFYRTEYYHDGDQWYFPELLADFSSLIGKRIHQSVKITADDILDFLFEIFDFSNIPEDFIRAVIGYDRLEHCVRETSEIFKPTLLIKIQEMIWQCEANAQYIDIGRASYAYLMKELAVKQQEEITTLSVKGFFRYSFVTKNNDCEPKPSIFILFSKPLKV